MYLYFLIERNIYDVDIQSYKIVLIGKEYKDVPGGFGGWSGVLCLLEPKNRANMRLTFSNSLYFVCIITFHHATESIIIYAKKHGACQESLLKVKKKLHGRKVNKLTMPSVVPN